MFDFYFEEKKQKNDSDHVNLSDVEMSPIKSA